MVGDEPTTTEGFVRVQREQRGNRERLEADRALYTRLKERGFEGVEMDRLRESLWVYGWRALRAWMKDGSIFERCAEKDVPVPHHSLGAVVLERRSDHRDEIAHDAVQYAVELFTTETLPKGRWDPNKGAAMHTYFMGSCFYTFRDVYKRWARRYRTNLSAAASPLIDDGLAKDMPPDDVVVLRETLRRILLGATWEARAICGLIYTSPQITQREIGDELGLTTRAVEGHMRRLRLHAKLLVRQGGVEGLYARLAAKRADDQ